MPRRDKIFAPQTQLEESANDRGKPEEPFIRDLEGLFSDPDLEAFGNSNCFESAKFCVFLCLCVHFIVGHLFDPLDAATNAISRKNTSKRGVWEQYDLCVEVD